jgi:hypothetical protein
MQVSDQLYTPDTLPRGKSPQYALDKSLGGPQSRFGSCAEKKDLLPLPRIEPRFLIHPSHSLVTMPTELSCLLGKLLM